jgi:serine/threonine protein kinase
MVENTKKRKSFFNLPDGSRAVYLGGRYRLGSFIGRGGMGDVYKVRDVFSQTIMAAKILRENDMDAVRRFQREAQLASAVLHPNLCKVHEVGICEFGSFLIMPMLDGLPLSRLLKEGPLAVDRAVRIACDILSGLEAVHAAGIIHRDLKPSNIFVSSPDGIDSVKLFDFGVAADENALSGKTTRGIALGTPHYMAPERLSSGVFNVRTDIYSMGVVLYEMITGKKPYTGAPLDVRDKVTSCAEMYEPPGSIVPNLSFELEEIIMRAMCHLPQDRFESASAMRRAVEDAPLVLQGGSRDTSGNTRDNNPVPSMYFRGDF